MLPFSRRYHKELIEKQTLKVYLPATLRGRLVRWLLNHDERTTDEYGNWSDRISDSTRSLLDYYGKKSLSVKDINSKEIATVGWEQFFAETYPSQVLDFLEVFLEQLPPDEAALDSESLNCLFSDEHCPWMVHNGRFIMVDTRYFEAELHRIADETLSLEPFQGAKDEFQRAREEATRGNHKDALFYSAKAYESALKVLSGKEDLTANDLVGALKELGFFTGLPEKGQSILRERVMLALPNLRNSLAGHGQGAKVITIPPSIGSLGVRLAAAFIVFLQERGREVGFQKLNAPVKAEEMDYGDDVPF